MPRLERFGLFQSLERAIQKGAEKIAPLIVWFAYRREYKRARSDAAPKPSARWVRNQANTGGRLTVTVFMMFLTVMTVVAFCMPLRPAWSDLEQRSLTTFPAASLKTVANGEYFASINTWFADTFPFREGFLKFQSELEEMYGFRSKKIFGEVGEADEIPDAPADASALAQAAKPVEPLTQPEPESSEGQTVPDASTSEAAQPDESTSKPDEPLPDVSVPKDAIDENAGAEEFETLDALLVRDNAAYEYYNFLQDWADQYIAMVNQAAKDLSGKAKVYDLIIPTSMDICVPARVRKGINTSDQRRAIGYMYSSMSDSVTTVDIFDTMVNCQAEDEYLYFRTDHHWTALGAYRAYQDFAKAAGVHVADLNKEFNEKVFEGFTGSFYRNLMSSTLANSPDTIYAYEPKDVTKATISWANGKVSEYPIINDVSDYSNTQKYSTFIGSDNPFTVIENPKITDGSSILVIKESFGNCFAPFLAESYQHVYVVDYRYYKQIDSRKLVDVVTDYNIKNVLFLNNISATRDSTVNQIQAFAQ